jgi:hypothetical protein
MLNFFCLKILSEDKSGDFYLQFFPDCYLKGKYEMLPFLDTPGYDTFFSIIKVEESPRRIPTIADKKTGLPVWTPE